MARQTAGLLSGLCFGAAVLLGTPAAAQTIDESIEVTSVPGSQPAAASEGIVVSVPPEEPAAPPAAAPVKKKKPKPAVAAAKEGWAAETDGAKAPAAKKPVADAKAKMAVAVQGKAAGGPKLGDTAIIVVVNDEPISNFKVDQRLSLMRMMGGDSDAGARLKARLTSPGINDQFKKFAMARNPKSKEDIARLQREFVEGIKRQVMGETRPGQRDKALVELINERLQIQEARRLDLMVTDEELDGMVGDLAKKNNKSTKDFEAMLGSQGIRRETFREKLRAQGSWQRVLSRRFRGQVSVANDEVERVVATGSVTAAAGPSLHVQRVLIAQSADAGEESKAAGYAEAEKLAGAAKGCKNFQALAKKIPGAKFENLPKTFASAFSEQARPILAAAKAGEVPPPMLTSAGIEVFAVCKVDAAPGAEAVPAEPATPDQKRDNARATLERTKMASLSKGLMSDLCVNASIDYRNGATSKRACGSE
jgi:peptidyl-prolyl cis-trans isomerase SurA